MVAIATAAESANKMLAYAGYVYIAWLLVLINNVILYNISLPYVGLSSIIQTLLVSQRDIVCIPQCPVDSPIKSVYIDLRMKRDIVRYIIDDTVLYHMLFINTRSHALL